MMDATGGNVTQPNEATFFHPSAKKTRTPEQNIDVSDSIKSKKSTHTEKCCRKR